MASVLKVKKIKEALNKALKVGYTEGSLTISDVNVTLCNLRPEEYKLIHDETRDKEEVEFLNIYREEHLCRAVVQIEDINFRDVDLIEFEQEAKDGSTETVKLEKHEYLREHVLKTWSREAISAAFVKFNDIVAKSEKTSMEGVTLDVPDETDEEKYRRLLLELRDVESQIPMDLASRLLAEQGYTKMVTTTELEAADRVLGQAKSEVIQAAPPPVEERPVAPPPPPPRAQVAVATQRAPLPPQPVREPEDASTQPAFREASPEELMRLRKPLNQQVGITSPEALAKSQRIAQEEGIAPEEMAAIEGSGDGFLRPALKLDPSKVALDSLPATRTNPRFQPPKR